jgi:hypothetical protein
MEMCFQTQVSEKMSRDPGLGTNLRPFVRTNLSESDREELL